MPFFATCTARSENPSGVQEACPCLSRNSVVEYLITDDFLADTTESCTCASLRNAKLLGFYYSRRSAACKTQQTQQHLGSASSARESEARRGA